MKRYFNFLTLVAIVLFIAQGCKKDEKQVIFEGGKAPELKLLTVNNESILLKKNKDKEFMRISWTNPDYKFNTGVSSQDVTYLLQIDTVGANFTNPNIQEIAISKDLQRTITVGEFNTYLNKMELAVDTLGSFKHNIEIRIVSTINKAIPLYSNVLMFNNIVMYEDFALPPPANDKLFIVGDGSATGWNNNPSAPVYLKLSKRGKFLDTLELIGGKGIKFLTETQKWQPQYGMVKDKGTSFEGDLGLNNNTGVAPYDKDPEQITTPPQSGKYEITLNFSTGKYSIKKI